MTKREDYIQEVREGIAERLRSMITASHYNMLPDEEFYKRISEILSDPRIAILDPEQNYEADLKCVEFEYALGYSDCIEDIQRDNRVKVIPKEEYIKEV